jgi:ribosomal protein L15
MKENTLKREHPNKAARQVGRGGTRGKQSGRGGKGQTARAGNKRRPQMRDIIKKLPKLRGYKFKSIDKPFVVAKEKVLVTAGKPESFSEIRKRLGVKGKKIVIK